MGNSEDLLAVIQKLAQLKPDQLDQLLTGISSQEDGKPKKRGRPKKNADPEPTLEIDYAQQRRNGRLVLGKRKNEFDTSGLKNKCKEDIKADKILTKNIEKRTEKPENRSYKILATCRICGKEGQAYAELTWKDHETNQTVFTCDKCENRGRR